MSDAALANDDTQNPDNNQPLPDGGDDGGKKPAATNGDAGTDGAAAKPLAAGGEAVKTEVPQTWPENWRNLIAGEDKKVLKTLDNMQSPADLFKSYNDLRADIAGRIKIPGEDATDKEKAAYAKALGIPETPEGYLENIKLSNDRVLGDNDKPIIQSFAEALHPHGATPQQIGAAADWWFDYQQAVAENQAQDDADYRVESEVALKQELGGKFGQITNAIGQVLFKGADQELQNQIFFARAPDGRFLGDHPEFVKMLGQWALELDPAGGQPADDGNYVSSMEDEIKAIEAEMRDPKKKAAYFKDEKKQARLRELYEMREKHQARNSAR